MDISLISSNTGRKYARIWFLNWMLDEWSKVSMWLRQTTASYGVSHIPEWERNLVNNPLLKAAICRLFGLSQSLYIFVCPYVLLTKLTLLNSNTCCEYSSHQTSCYQVQDFAKLLNTAYLSQSGLKTAAASPQHMVPQSVCSCLISNLMYCFSSEIHAS